MKIFVFTITYNDGDMSICQVYGQSIVKAMVNLELICGCNDACIDYIGSELTTDPLNFDDCDCELLQSTN